jgi:hypothetical protein
MNATTFVLSMALVMETGCENSGSANEQSADKSDRSSSSNGSTSARDFVSLSVTSETASMPVAFGLYLPEVWTKDRNPLRALYGPRSAASAANSWVGRGRHTRRRQAPAALAAFLPAGILCARNG